MTDSNCAICMEDFTSSRNDNDTPNSSSDGMGSCVPCGHCFHVSCFEQWRTAQESMRRPVKCPACNRVNQSFQKLFITFANKNDNSGDDMDSSDSDSDESSDGDEQCTNYNTGDNDETGSPKNNSESRQTVNAFEIDAHDGNSNARVSDGATQDQPIEILLEGAAPISTVVQQNQNSHKKRKKNKDAKANSKPNDPNRHRYYKRKTKRHEQRIKSLEQIQKERYEQERKLLESHEILQQDLERTEKEYDLFQKASKVQKMEWIESKIALATAHRLKEHQETTLASLQHQLATSKQAQQDLDRRYKRDVERAHATSLVEVQELLQEQPKLLQQNRTLQQEVNQLHDLIMKQKRNAATDASSKDSDSKNPLQGLPQERTTARPRSKSKMIKAFRQEQQSMMQENAPPPQQPKPRLSRNETFSLQMPISANAARMSRAVSSVSSNKNYHSGKTNKRQVASVTIPNTNSRSRTMVSAADVLLGGPLIPNSRNIIRSKKSNIATHSARLKSKETNDPASTILTGAVRLKNKRTNNDIRHYSINY